MIKFEKHILKNGLTLIFHKDITTPIGIVNLLYDVGARDEDENKTGFAHLFEHLMFGGSKNIPNYDEPLQMAGGECNAFTNNDITNYYNTFPKENLETALWLESDRMLELAFTPQSLEVQRNVVIEEFKQRYLNQPYGDVWLHFRPLIYKKHPYQWATIGKKIEHIENATLQDVKDFFYKYYGPQNAILVIGGNYEWKEVKAKVEKWFGDIPMREKNKRNLPVEPIQNEKRVLNLERDVPSDTINMAFRVGNRISDDFYLGDLTSDILSSGQSSRLYIELVKNKSLFTDINAYIIGGYEDGLFIVSGKLSDNIGFEEAENAIWEQLNKMAALQIEQNELTKVVNKYLTAKAFQEQSLLNRVMNIAQFELLGILDDINRQKEIYESITPKQIQEFCKKVFQVNNTSVLTVKAQK